MSNEIEKKDNNATAIQTKRSFELPESISDFGIEDLRLSTIFICQDQSNKARDKEIKPGSLYDSITFEEFVKIPVIFIYSFTTRILYGDSVGDPLKCYSQDGKIPSHSSPIHPNCVSCPENIKPADKIEKGKSKYGKCNRTFNFACIPPKLEAGDERDFPFIVPFQRTNAQTAKNLINLVFRKRQELYTLTREIETIETRNDKGRFYTLQVNEGEKINDSDFERSKYWLAFIKAMVKAQKLIIDSSSNEGEKNITPDNDGATGDIPF